MSDLVVRLDGDPRIELQNVDVGVDDDVIAFDIEGVIRGLDESALADLRDSSLQPTEIRFGTVGGGG